MDNIELAEYIKNNIPTFINIRVVNEGVAFHYTSHSEAITYSKAVIATHSQEASLEFGAPDTLLILCNDIISFRKIEI